LFAGSQLVSSGETASSTIVSGGGLFVLAGGLADPIVVSRHCHLLPNNGQHRDARLV
jgi:autotransporter passenger strand-loop-strand repeat protein